MEKRIIIFRFDTLSHIQCYSSEVMLKVDATKTPLEHWEDYLALLPLDKRYQCILSTSTIDNKSYVTYVDRFSGEVIQSLQVIRYRWINEKNFQLL